MNKKKLIILADALLQRKWRLATAESCTGGALSGLLTAQPGSSSWFECGFVSYSNASKSILLGVPAGLIAIHGAVSAEVVEAMVRGVWSHSCANIAVAISGIAGPDGAVAGKPVGTVYLAWGLTSQDAVSQRYQFHGDRAVVREQAMRYALDGLISMLSDTAWCPEEDSNL